MNQPSSSSISLQRSRRSIDRTTRVKRNAVATEDEEDAVEVTDQSPQERLEGPSDVEEEITLTTVRTRKAAPAATLPGAVAVTVATVCAIGAVSKVVRGRADVVVHQPTVVPSPKEMKIGLTTPQATAAP